MFGKKRGDMTVFPYSEKSDIRFSHVTVVPLRGIRNVKTRSIEYLVGFDVTTVEERLENRFRKESVIAVGMVGRNFAFVQKTEPGF